MTMDLPFVIALPARLDLGTVADLLAVIQEKTTTNDIMLDANDVRLVSFAGVQLILSALREPNISIANPSPAFVNTMTALGFAWKAESEVIAATADDAIVPSASEHAEVPGLDEAHAIAETDNADMVSANGAETAQPMNAASPSIEPKSSAPANEDGERQPVRILTIDDSKTIRDMLRLTLSAAGFEVVQAVDGEDGIEKLRASDVDLVITDINMPRMDGYEVIRTIRSDRAYDDTPVLVLSTESAQENVEIARSTGATGWMVKPFNPSTLLETVRQVVA